MSVGEARPDRAQDILSEDQVLAFGKRLLEKTVGRDLPVRLILAGGAFKSLIHGRAPRDIDIWVTSPEDHLWLVDRLLARVENRKIASGPFGDAFQVNGITVDVPRKPWPSTLEARLLRFDIALSAVGVEHEAGTWRVMVHPLARESVQRQQVLLLKPLANWPYGLVTLDRMMRYGQELGYEVPSHEEEEIWRIFDELPIEEQEQMIARFRKVVGEGEHPVLARASAEATRICAGGRLGPAWAWPGPGARRPR